MKMNDLTVRIAAVSFVLMFLVCLFRAPVSSFEIRKENIYPKIITPNGDGYNDRFFVRFYNPYDNQLDAKIYNLQGCEIAVMVLNRNEDYFYWDGKDSGGAVVNPGVYIFQVVGEGEVFNGIIVVAR